MIAAADCRNAAGTSRYSFIWASPIAWLNSLSLVNNDGYYLTTAQKTKDNVFFNGTNVYPISFALAGAGMIAYAGESPQKCFHHLLHKQSINSLDRTFTHSLLTASPKQCLQH